MRDIRTGIEIISAERQRQVCDEDRTPEHDDQHLNGELAMAGACYALPYWMRVSPPSQWPWDYEDWKPTPHDRIRELAKAGALIAAEIDRLQRRKVDRDA